MFPSTLLFAKDMLTLYVYFEYEPIFPVGIFEMMIVLKLQFLLYFSSLHN